MVLCLRQRCIVRTKRLQKTTVSLQRVRSQGFRFFMFGFKFGQSSNFEKRVRKAAISATREYAIGILDMWCSATASDV